MAGGVIHGNPERPGAVHEQPSRMVRLASRSAKGPGEVAADVLTCVVALTVSQVLGFVDLSTLSWIDAGFGAAALAATGGIGALRVSQHLTDRLEVTDRVADGVALDDCQPDPARWRRVARSAASWLGWTAFLAAGIGLMRLLEDDEANHWALVFCALYGGVSVREHVTRRMTAAHERSQGVRIYRAEDEDEWYEQATGKDLEENDPGPLFHRPADGD